MLDPNIYSRVIAFVEQTSMEIGLGGFVRERRIEREDGQLSGESNLYVEFTTRNKKIGRVYPSHQLNMFRGDVIEYIKQDMADDLAEIKSYADLAHGRATAV